MTIYKYMGDPITHKRVGGKLCLDYVNTRNGHHKTHFNEYLNNYHDLVLWVRYSHVFTPKESDTLIQKGKDHPIKSGRFYKKAIEFRKNLFQVFSSIISHSSVPQKSLRHLTVIHQEGVKNSLLVQSNTGISWLWESPLSMDRILWPIALSATRLLTSENLKWVRQCSGTDCDWFFLDTSRNKKRRWCSMEECGNRHKMRQRYIRQKQSI